MQNFFYLTPILDDATVTGNNPPEEEEEEEEDDDDMLLMAPVKKTKSKEAIEAEQNRMKIESLKKNNTELVYGRDSYEKSNKNYTKSIEIQNMIMNACGITNANDVLFIDDDPDNIRDLNANLPGCKTIWVKRNPTAFHPYGFTKAHGEIMSLFGKKQDDQLETIQMENGLVILQKKVIKEGDDDNNATNKK